MNYWKQIIVEECNAITDNDLAKAVSFFNSIEYRGRSNWKVIDNQVMSFSYKLKKSHFGPISYWNFEAVAIYEYLFEKFNLNLQERS